MTATLSVLAVQERLIWEDETALADRLVGTDGGVVSVEDDDVVNVVSDDTARFPCASRDLTT